MLLIGGAAYLGGGLSLAARLLRRSATTEGAGRRLEHPEAR